MGSWDILICMVQAELGTLLPLSKIKKTVFVHRLFNQLISNR